MNLELNLGVITRPDGVKIKIGDFVVVALDSKTSVTGTFDDMNLSDGTINLGTVGFLHRRLKTSSLLIQEVLKKLQM